MAGPLRVECECAEYNVANGTIQLDIGCDAWCTMGGGYR